MKEGAQKENHRPKRRLFKHLALGAIMLGAGDKTAKSEDWAAETTEAPVENIEPESVPDNEQQIEEIEEDTIAPIEEMTPEIARDIESWVQKDFYKTIDTLRFLAENPNVNGVMIYDEILKLTYDNDDNMDKAVLSLGIEPEDLADVAQEIAHKDNDIPEGAYYIEEYKEDEYLKTRPEIAAEVDQIFGRDHTNKSEVVLIRRTYIYERWLKEKLRELYRRYDGHQNISAETVKQLYIELDRLEKAMSTDDNWANEAGTVIGVIAKERTGEGLPLWGMRSTWHLDNNTENEDVKSIKTYEIKIFPVDFGTGHKIILFPHVPDDIRAKITSHFQDKAHETNGLVVIDLGGKAEEYDISRWEEDVKVRLYEVGLSYGTAFTTNWGKEDQSSEGVM
jgi:hypothetical protein